MIHSAWRLCYLTAMDMQAFAPPTAMLAMQILPINKPIRVFRAMTNERRVLPDRSWSATVRNLALPEPILETNWPSSVTSLYLFSRFSRGMRTLSKLKYKTLKMKASEI